MLEVCSAVSPSARQRFDEQLDRVLAEMPPMIHKLLEEVPLHVEDYPSDDVIEHFDLEYRDDLCGLHDGVPLTKRSIEAPWRLPDRITVYREGIVAAAADRHGRVRLSRLRNEIRITILHELGHHHGLTEEELKELGYQ
jgi:predicted Zn-dependent protease with MMP-like domain